METLNNILSGLDKLQGLPAAGLVFVLCIAIGYAWRGANLKWFPNDAIPVVVMVMWAVFMMFIADGRPTTMPHHVWTARNLAVGFVIGAVAWAVHNYIISRFESKLAGLFGKQPDPPPPAGQPPQTPVK